jgi:hypothetical protein
VSRNASARPDTSSSYKTIDSFTDNVVDNRSIISTPSSIVTLFDIVKSKIQSVKNDGTGGRSKWSIVQEKRKALLDPIEMSKSYKSMLTYLQKECDNNYQKAMDEAASQLEVIKEDRVKMVKEWEARFGAAEAMFDSHRLGKSLKIQNKLLKKAAKSVDRKRIKPTKTNVEITCSISGFTLVQIYLYQEELQKECKGFVLIQIQIYGKILEWKQRSKWAKFITFSDIIEILKSKIASADPLAQIKELGKRRAKDRDVELFDNSWSVRSNSITSATAKDTNRLPSFFMDRRDSSQNSVTIKSLAAIKKSHTNLLDESVGRRNSSIITPQISITSTTPWQNDANMSTTTVPEFTFSSSSVSNLIDEDNTKLSTLRSNSVLVSNINEVSISILDISNNSASLLDISSNNVLERRHSLIEMLDMPDFMPLPKNHDMRRPSVGLLTLDEAQLARNAALAQQVLINQDSSASNDFDDSSEESFDMNNYSDASFNKSYKFGTSRSINSALSKKSGRGPYDYRNITEV